MRSRANPWWSRCDLFGHVDEDGSDDGWICCKLCGRLVASRTGPGEFLFCYPELVEVLRGSGKEG